MSKKGEVSIFYGGFSANIGGVNIHLGSLKRGLERLGYIVYAHTLDDLPFGLKYLPHSLEKLVNFFWFPLGFVYKGVATKILFQFFFTRKVDF